MADTIFKQSLQSYNAIRAATVTKTTVSDPLTIVKNRTKYYNTLKFPTFNIYVPHSNIDHSDYYYYANTSKLNVSRAIHSNEQLISAIKRSMTIKTDETLANLYERFIERTESVAHCNLSSKESRLVVNPERFYMMTTTSISGCCDNDYYEYTPNVCGVAHSQCFCTCTHCQNYCDCYNCSDCSDSSCGDSCNCNSSYDCDCDCNCNCNRQHSDTAHSNTAAYSYTVDSGYSVQMIPAQPQADITGIKMYNRPSSVHLDYCNSANTYYGHTNIAHSNVINIIQEKIKNPLSINREQAIQTADVTYDSQVINFYTYDEDSPNNTYIKIYIRKTQGTNTYDWTLVKDSLIDSANKVAYTINAKDPMGKGWTTTTQSEGTYEIKAIAYNKAFTDSKYNANADTPTVTVTHPQLESSAFTTTFQIKYDTIMDITFTQNAGLTDATLFKDGVMQANGEKYSYYDFNSTAATANQKGVYLTMSINEPDTGQYIIGTVTAKAKSSGTTVATKSVVYLGGSSNNSHTHLSKGVAQNAYVFFDRDLFANVDEKGVYFTYEFKSYYDSTMKRLADTKVGVIANPYTQANRDGNDIVYVKFNLPKTLNIDEFSFVQPVETTTYPSVSIKVNTEAHLWYSLKEFKYQLTKSPTPEANGTWIYPTDHSVDFDIKENGIWYVHLSISDHYGETITQTIGPIYYSPSTLSLYPPKLTHENMYDEVTGRIMPSSLPTIGVTYQYSFGIMRDGETSITWYPYTSNISDAVKYLYLYNGRTKVYSRIKLVETGWEIVSDYTETSLGEKLVWAIRNQQNFTSTARHNSELHGTSGYTWDNWRYLSDLPTNLANDLRRNEYIYFKFENDEYTGNKIIYFEDTVKTNTIGTLDLDAKDDTIIQESLNTVKESAADTTISTTKPALKPSVTEIEFTTQEE